MKNKNTYHKDSGFKVPDDYFENLQDQLMDHVVLKSELPNDTGFKVPDGYFDSLTDELLSNDAIESNDPKVKKLNWWYPALAVAAGLAVLFSLNITGESTSNLDFAQLETAEFEEYFAYQSPYDQIESLELLYEDQAELLEDINIHEELSQDALYNYLLDDLELNEIIIE